MGGSKSAEFQVLAQNGEDAIVACASCAYAANVEVAESVFEPAGEISGGVDGLESIHTPSAKTIEEVVAFVGDGLRPEGMLKSLLFVAGEELVMAVVRGDHDVNEIKLARRLGVDEVFLAADADVRKATGAEPGFAGPVGFEGRIIADPPEGLF